MTSVSMPVNVGVGSKVGTYQPADYVELARKAVWPHLQRSSVAQLLKPGAPEYVFRKPLEVVAAWCAGGRRDVTEAHMLGFDMARRHVGKPWGLELLAETQATDLREDLTETALRLVAPDCLLDTDEKRTTARRYLADLERSIVADQIEASALRKELGL